MECSNVFDDMVPLPLGIQTKSKTISPLTILFGSTDCFIIVSVKVFCLCPPGLLMLRPHPIIPTSSSFSCLVTHLL